MLFELIITSPSSLQPYRSRMRLIRERITNRLLLHEERWAFFWTLDAEETLLSHGAEIVSDEDLSIAELALRAFAARRAGMSLTYLGKNPLPLEVRMESKMGDEIDRDREEAGF